MSGLYLVELADWLRAAGLTVIEWDGWKTRARGSGGFTGNRPWCVMWHHTASNASINGDAGYCATGSPDAPICNIIINPNGSVTVIAAGATNTNGKGRPLTFSRGTVPADQMNTHAVGMEIANNGVGEEYPVEQIDAAFAASLVICGALGLQPDDCAGHWDYAPDRKIDPATADAVQGDWWPHGVTSSGTWSLDDVRAECRARATHLPPPQPPTEDDMTFIYAFKHYADTFSESGVALTPEAYNAMKSAGAVVIVSDDHETHLESLLHLSGLDRAALTPK